MHGDIAPRHDVAEQLLGACDLDACPIYDSADLDRNEARTLARPEVGRSRPALVLPVAIAARSAPRLRRSTASRRLPRAKGAVLSGRVGGPASPSVATRHPASVNPSGPIHLTRSAKRHASAATPSATDMPAGNSSGSICRTVESGLLQKCRPCGDGLLARGRLLGDGEQGGEVIEVYEHPAEVAADRGGRDGRAA